VPERFHFSLRIRKRWREVPSPRLPASPLPPIAATLTYSTPAACNATVKVREILRVAEAGGRSEKKSTKQLEAMLQCLVAVNAFDKFLLRTTPEARRLVLLASSADQASDKIDSLYGKVSSRPHHKRARFGR